VEPPLDSSVTELQTCFMSATPYRPIGGSRIFFRGGGGGLWEPERALGGSELTGE